MTEDEAKQLGERVSQSRWVERIQLRENEKAPGGYAVSIWLKGQGHNKPDRFACEVVMGEMKRDFNELFPQYEGRLTRNRDFTFEHGNSLRSL